MTQDFILETPRLILRHPQDNDAEELNLAINAFWPALQEWMSWASDDQKNIKATRDYIAFTQEEAAKGEYPLLGFSKQTGDFVIATGIHSRPEDRTTYSTGYWVNKDYLGQGYATEAAYYIIKFAFESLAAQAIHIEYYDGNEKSRNVIEKLGFTFTETKAKAHQKFSNGEFCDVHRYIMRDISDLREL